MNKHTALMHMPLADTTAFGSTFDTMITKGRSLARIKIPIVYQDETGFQLGVKPAEKEINGRRFGEPKPRIVAALPQKMNRRVNEF
jgi:hypothetical protein